MRKLETVRIDLPKDPDTPELNLLEIAGNDTPFVLLHGLTGHRDDFRGVLPELAADNDVRWLVPDLRGHGDFTQTGQESTFGFDRLVADLALLLDRLEIDHCDLLGHSFGGMLALRFVLAHPARVQSLVLMDTAPVAPDGYDVALFEKSGSIARERGMVFLQGLVEKAARANASPSASDLQTRKWADEYWPHHVLRYTAMDPVAYGALGVAMVCQQPVVDRLCEIECPTTILVGEDDIEFLRGADLLEAGIRGARRVTIPDAGHHPHRENREAWLDAMRAHRALGRRTSSATGLRDGR